MLPSRKNIKQDMIKCKNINEINVDCIKCILSKLSVKQKFGVQRVCKLWKNLIEELLKQEEELIFSHFGEGFGISDAMDELIVPHMLPQTVVTIEKLMPLMTKLTNIKVLKFYDCNINQQTLLWLIENCPKLNSLFIRKDPLYDWPLIENVLQNKLINLEIDFFSMDVCVANLVEKNPQLNSLTLSECYRAGQLFDALGNEIRKLDTIFPKLSLSDIQSFNAGNGKKITHFKSKIYTNGDTQLINNYALLLKSMVHLQVLHLELFYDSFVPILLTVGSLKSVTKLKLSGRVDFPFLETDPPANTSVKSLTLYRILNFSDLRFICKVFKNVEKLHLRSINKCSSLHVLLSMLPHLKQLSLNFCKIDESFLQTLPSLSQLELIEALDPGSWIINKEDIVSLLEACVKLTQTQASNKFHILLGEKLFKEYTNSCESIFCDTNLIIRETLTKDDD